MILSRFHRCLLLFFAVVAASFALTANAAPPTTPDNFRFEVYSDSAAELFWQRSTNVAVSGYELTRNGESLGIFDALSYFDDTLSIGVDYTYTVAAIGIDGDRSGAAVLTLRTPQIANTVSALMQEISALKNDINVLESLLDSGVRAPVVQTGQNVSNQPGDDGDLQAGIAWPDPRFRLNVNAADDSNENGVCDSNETCNGTITDNLTNLIWLQQANCFGEQNWNQALVSANNLADDGASSCGLDDNSLAGDWRLPNIKEIQSLLDFGHAFPDLLLPDGHPFVDVQAGGITSFPSRYWTSTSIGPSINSYYGVSISVGWVERLGSNLLAYVWPVRGGM